MVIKKKLGGGTENQTRGKAKLTRRDRETHRGHGVQRNAQGREDWRNAQGGVETHKAEGAEKSTSLIPTRTHNQTHKQKGAHNPLIRNI